MAAAHNNTTWWIALGAAAGAAYYFRDKLAAILPSSSSSTTADPWAYVSDALVAANTAATSAANAGATPAQQAAAAQIAATAASLPAYQPSVATNPTPCGMEPSDPTSAAFRSWQLCMGISPDVVNGPAVDPYDPATHPGAIYGPQGNMTITQFRDWQNEQSAAYAAQARTNIAIATAALGFLPPLTQAMVDASKTDPALAYLLQRDLYRRGLA